MNERMDPFHEMSRSEVEEKKKKVEELGLEKSDVWFLFFNALKIFLPFVLLVCSAYLIFWLLFKLLL